MKQLVLPALLWALTIPLFAQSGAWAGYVTYAPGPVRTQVGVQDNDLMWLGDMARLAGMDRFTFLGRRDDAHWMALTRQETSWLLQIHDETARFNFRADVNPKTGRMTVERGVDWVGTDRNTDAARAARMAVGYVNRARLALDLFPFLPAPAPLPSKPKPKTEKPRVEPPMAKAPMAKGPMVEGPVESRPLPDDAIPNPMLGNGGAAIWQKLVDGNLRFVSGKVTHPDQSMARVEETARGQHPFAIVVSCSDSRVPPEVLFDQGIGDLFVVRTAGEVVTDVELGSIEYAVEHLGVGYLVVLGHKYCGAVDATVKGGDLPPHLEAIAAQIRPAVEAARFLRGDLLDNAVRENARSVLAKIQGTPALAEAMKSGKLNARAAYYDLDTGKVAALP